MEFLFILWVVWMLDGFEVSKNLELSAKFFQNIVIAERDEVVDSKILCMAIYPFASEVNTDVKVFHFHRSLQRNKILIFLVFQKNGFFEFSKGVFKYTFCQSHVAYCFIIFWSVRLMDASLHGVLKMKGGGLQNFM